MPDSHAALSELLSRHEVAPAGAAAARLSRYLQLLAKWGARVRLTGSTAWSNVGPLLEEAVWAATLYPPGQARHLDVGSGAGFPAVPLAVLRPDVAVELVEPLGKRAAFLETVAAELGLDNVRVVQERLAAFLARSGEAARDAVSWKAVRLEGEELGRLIESAPAALWVFHGRDVPGDEVRVLSRYALESRRAVPGRAASWLSVYRLIGRR